MQFLTDRNIIIGLILLQLLICVPFMNSFSIGLDEPFTIFYAQQDFDSMFKMFASENNPPLHFVLLHFWIKLFGISAWAVRSLSLLFSVLTIPVLYKLGRKMLPVNFSVLFVLFFIFSRFDHYHALEARTYSLFVLLFSLLLYDLYRLIFEDKRPFVRLALWNTLLLYTHYLGGFIIAVEFVLLICFFKRLDGKMWLFFIFSLAGSAILYIPGIRLFLLRMGHFSGKGTWVPEPQWTELYGNILRFNNSQLNAVLLVLAGLTLAGISFRKDRGRLVTALTEPKLLFILIAFVIPYFGMFAMSKVFQPVFLDRYLLFTTVPLYLLMSLLLNVVNDGKLKGMFPLAFALPFVFSVGIIPTNNRDDKNLAAYVADLNTNNTLILICPPTYDLTFTYHYVPEAFRDYQHFEERKKLMGIAGIYGVGEIPGDKEEIVFIDAASDFLYPGNGINDRLKAGWRLVDEKCFEGNYCVHYYRGQ